MASRVATVVTVVARARMVVNFISGRWSVCCRIPERAEWRGNEGVARLEEEAEEANSAAEISPCLCVYQQCVVTQLLVLTKLTIRVG